MFPHPPDGVPQDPCGCGLFPLLCPPPPSKKGEIRGAPPGMGTGDGPHRGPTPRLRKGAAYRGTEGGIQSSGHMLLGFEDRVLAPDRTGPGRIRPRGRKRRGLRWRRGLGRARGRGASRPRFPCPRTGHASGNPVFHRRRRGRDSERERAPSGWQFAWKPCQAQGAIRLKRKTEWSCRMTGREGAPGSAGREGRRHYPAQRRNGSSRSKGER